MSSMQPTQAWVAGSQVVSTAQSLASSHPATHVEVAGSHHLPGSHEEGSDSLHATHSPEATLQ